MLKPVSAAMLSNVPIHHTPSQKFGRSDVHFPLTTPRKRSIPVLIHAATEDGQSGGIPKVKSKQESRHSDTEPNPSTTPDVCQQSLDTDSTRPESQKRPTNLLDLPEELLNRIFDEILGTLRPVHSSTTATTSISQRMRHPRRHAVAELALISQDIRVLVQERIYRHIKIKATRDGLLESRGWFEAHPHLADSVRHIEYWIPIWGDRKTEEGLPRPTRVTNNRNELADGGNTTTNGPPSDNFKLCTYSATLEQIFDHLGLLFQQSSILTVEGGHCRNSHMIKHFKSNLFNPILAKRLRILPQIKVFAVKGAWNIMRTVEDWQTIQEALPAVVEWHCRYSKPRTEAYQMLNAIMLKLPSTIKRLEISLDSMFTKEEPILGSHRQLLAHHLCEQLGSIAPRLESLSYTGKICECFWSAALSTLMRDKSLICVWKKLDVVVKPCSRQRVYHHDPVTGYTLVEDVNNLSSEVGGITNLAFIAAFERLVAGAIAVLKHAPSLHSLRLRYVDLDSGACQPLNPYWSLDGGVVTGIWNDRLLDRLTQARPDLHYYSLEDGMMTESAVAERKQNESAGAVRHGHEEDDMAPYVQRLPRMIPKSINTDTYKMIAEARV